MKNSTFMSVASVMIAAIVVLSAAPSYGTTDCNRDSLTVPTGAPGTVIVVRTEGLPEVHDVESRAELDTLVAALDGDCDVQTVEADTLLAVDLDYPPAGPGQGGVVPWEDGRIGAATNRDAGLTGEGVRVAVFDTGVDGDVIPVAGGIDPRLAEEGAHLIDVDGHGTQTASVIHRLAPDASIYSVKVLSGPYSARSALIRGIEWSVRNDIDVVQMAFGMRTHRFPDEVVEQTLRYAQEQGITLVASAGNRYMDGSPPQYPAASVHTIGVAAIDRHDRRASFSSVGGFVDVAAPGVELTSMDNSGQVARYGGTSGASALVSAGLSQLLSATPSRVPQLYIRSLLTRTAQHPQSTHRDNQFGHGIVNLEQAATQLADDLDRTTHIHDRGFNRQLTDHVRHIHPSWAHPHMVAAAERAAPFDGHVHPDEVWFDPQQLAVERWHAHSLNALHRTINEHGPLPDVHNVYTVVVNNDLTYTLTRLTYTTDNSGQLLADVPATSAFASYINAAVTAGIVQGHPDGTFRGDTPVTRQSAINLLHRSAGRPPVPPTTRFHFADVPAEHPAFEAATWAAQRGIARGYGNGDFLAKEPVTRQAAVAFLHRYHGSPQPDGPPPFSDIGLDHQFANAIAWAAQHGIAAGHHDGTFQPHSITTREQMVAFLARAENDGWGA